MLSSHQGIKAPRHPEAAQKPGLTNEVRKTRIDTATGLAATVLIASSMFLTGCGEEDPLEPPRLHYGQDVCVVCHMIISDERYAAAISIEDERGRIHKHGFDDIGCIFEYEQQNPDQPIMAYFVRDARSHGWIDATRAEFVHSREIHTPMAFGLAAFPTLPDARDLSRQVEGDLITIEEARRRFRMNTLHVSTLGEEPKAVERDMSNERIVEVNDEQLRIRLESPQTLLPGEHPFELTITETRTGNGDEARAAENLAIEIEPWMPSMSHGSPNNMHPESLGGGRYRGQAHFTMSGHWIVRVAVRRSGDEPGTEPVQVTFHFEVQR